MPRLTPFRLVVLSVLVAGFTFAVLNRTDHAAQPGASNSDRDADATQGPLDWDAREDRERQRQFEWHMREVELKKTLAEAQVKVLERASEAAGVAERELATAAYALAEIRRLAGPDEAAKILGEMLEKTEEAALKRLVRIELAQLHADRDQPGEAVQHLRKLILPE